VCPPGLLTFATRSLLVMNILINIHACQWERFCAMVARCLARVFKRLPTSRAYLSHLSATRSSLDAGPGGVLQTHKGCYGHDECLISERGNKEAPRPKVFKITCSPPMYASQTYHWRRPVVPGIVHILQETICIVAVPMQAVFTMKTIPLLPSAAISDERSNRPSPVSPSLEGGDGAASTRVLRKREVLA
jgi:hypothetical protein